jgi:tRNA A-37 threonylcarbamoyl transferase component Bud32
MVGRVVGSYRIIEKIGEGGMGAVYRAVDEMLDREVAVKAIRPELARDPEIVERFRAEAKILARVHHPAIATIYSFFHDGGELFLAMEYVRGRTLSAVLAAAGALPWRRAVPLLSTALEGIEQAHRAGIIHRDLKPDNLMLTEDGALKVMDFGIARVPGSNHLTRTGLLIGTLRYVAPEQIRGEEVDRRTDLYALGVVLYQMLTGRVPFEGPTDFAILKAQIEDPPAPPRSLVPEIPEGLERIVLKALEKSPDARFQTAGELRAALAGLGSLPLGKRDEDLPTLVLPPRPAAARVPASPETIETDRPRLPATPPPAVVAPAVAAPAAPGTSYRPVGRKGWKLPAIAAGLVLAAVAAALLVGEHRESGLADIPSQRVAAPAPAAPGPAPVQTETSTTATAVPVTQPPRPAPAPERREIPKPARPEPVAAEPSVEKAAPAPAEPAPVQETPPEPVAGDLSQDLPRLAGELVERSEKLGELYEDFLGKKEDGGAELTEADGQLKDEIEALAEEASRFNKGINKSFFARTWSHLKKSDQQADVLRRSQGFEAALGRVERLMAQTRPGPEVRQEWQEIRRRWVAVTRTLGTP